MLNEETCTNLLFLGGFSLLQNFQVAQSQKNRRRKKEDVDFLPYTSASSRSSLCNSSSDLVIFLLVLVAIFDVHILC